MSSKFTYTELELIVQLKANSKDAFEYLYERYSAALYGVILKVVKDEEKAADALQDSFFENLENIGSYNPEKGTLFTWILNVARNTAIDKLRMDVKVSKVVNWEQVHETELLPVAIYHPAVSLVDVRAIVAALLPERRLLIEMVYFEGYTHEETAETLSIPLGTVKSRIREILQELRVVFGAEVIKLKLAG